MSNIEKILREGLAADKYMLAQITDHSSPLGWPAWAGEKEKSDTIACIKLQISNWEEIIINGGPSAMEKWWDGLSENTREQLRNM